MKLQTALVLVCVLTTSLSLPVQIGILASNSNEILRLNGLTLATLGQTQVQGPQIIPQYVLQQQQPEVLFTPQVVNLNPQMTGPFGPQGPQMTGPFGPQGPQMTGPFGPQGPQLLVPTQGNQLNPFVFPNGQQEQPGSPQDPNAPIVPQQTQNPVQMFPQYQYPAYYPAFPQQPRMGFPYYLPPYGYPQQRNTVLQPNNRQVVQPQLNLERTTQKPQFPLQQASQPNGQLDKIWPTGTQKVPTMSPPDQRGDTTGPGVDEGNPNFPFMFEP